jgi:hypothetical protein
VTLGHDALDMEVRMSTTGNRKANGEDESQHGRKER